MVASRRLGTAPLFVETATYITVDVEALISKISPSARGIYSSDVADLLRSEGVAVGQWPRRNVADLARYTADGTPVIVRIADRVGGTDFAHFVVVDGVTTKAGKSVVAIRDPHGTRYYSPVETFEKTLQERSSYLISQNEPLFTYQFP